MAFCVSEAAKRKAYDEQQAEMSARSSRLRSRLAAKVAEQGPDSMWAEMLVEHDARHAND